MLRSTAPDSRAPTHSIVNRVLQVLLVEDDPVVELLVRRILRVPGHAVVTGRDVRQCIIALQDVASPRIDVILMDIQILNTDVFEALRAIRAHEERRGTRVPIIALTTNPSTGDRERCVDAGVDDHVVKPIRRRELFAAMERVLDRPPPASVPSRGEILARFEWDWDTLHEVVPVLRLDSRRQVREIVDAVGCRDSDRVRRAARSLRGGVSFFGESSVLEIAELLESAGERDRLDRATQLGVRLQEEFVHFDRQLRQLQTTDVREV